MAMKEHGCQASTPAGKLSLDRATVPYPSMAMLGQGSQNVGNRINYLCTQDTVNVEMVGLSVHIPAYSLYLTSDYDIISNLYMQQRTTRYDYTPSDFLLLSVLTVAVCGFLSPPSLTLSIPALYYSKKVHQSNLTQHSSYTKH